MKSGFELELFDINNPVKINVFETDNINFPFHYHPVEYELTLILGNKGTRLVGNNISEFTESDLVLIGPGLPHNWINYFDDHHNSQEKIRVIAIHFTDSLLGKDTLKRKEFFKIKELLNTATKGILFYGEIKNKIAIELMKLKIEPDFHTIIELLLILNELAETNDKMFLCHDSYSFSGKVSEIRNFEEVFIYIADHFREKIKITDVANKIGMNDSAFSHYFKKRTSRSFTDFINELRLNHASIQLHTSKTSIAEICFDSGFNNLSNFNRTFKKWKGITPLQWRKSRI